MEDLRVGAALRAVRVRRGWRQLDVANAAGVSRALVSLMERGHLGRVSLDTLRRVAAVLDVRLDVIARWRGGELDRLLNAAHSGLEDAVARWLAGVGGWTVVPEVSFAIYGERGWIDLLAWHAASRSVLIVEVKTEIVDVQDLIGKVDRKRRLARKIVRERGWAPETVSVWVVVAEGPTNRRRFSSHESLLRAAFPVRGGKLRTWVRTPAGSTAAISFFSYATGHGARRSFASRKRVRRLGSPSGERG